MQKKLEITYNMSDTVKYKITLDDLAVVTVSKQHLYKPRWVTYFGGIEGVKEFIKNYNNGH